MSVDLRSELRRERRLRELLGAATVRPLAGLPDRAFGPTGPYVLAVLGPERPWDPPAWVACEDVVTGGTWFLAVASRRGFLAAYSPGAP